jgi:hypothetical protein
MSRYSLSPDLITNIAFGIFLAFLALSEEGDKG